jgi:hypothetical protein
MSLLVLLVVWVSAYPLAPVKSEIYHGCVGALIMAANEIFGWELCQQLHFGCASGHVAKILGHIIKYASPTHFTITLLTES